MIKSWKKIDKHNLSLDGIDVLALDINNIAWQGTLYLHESEYYLSTLTGSVKPYYYILISDLQKLPK